MTEDTRVCPVCKKFPPSGQVWKNFKAHVQNHSKKPVEEKTIYEILEDVFKSVLDLR